MESDRPYCKALGKQTIITEIKENAGSQFDPVIVEAFLKVVHEWGLVEVKSLNGGPQD